MSCELGVLSFGFVEEELIVELGKGEGGLEKEGWVYINACECHIEIQEKAVNVMVM